MQLRIRQIASGASLALLVLMGVACSAPLMRGPLGFQTFLPDSPEAGIADVDEYTLHLPASCTGDDLRPLIVAFHGAFSSPREMAEESRLNELADREGLIVAYPYGSGFLSLLQHWNSGHCCGPAHENGVDDVAFTRRVISAVVRRAPVDRSRVYVVGMSNGAMMAHRIASEMSDVVAATAAVSGTIGGRPAEGREIWRISPPPRPSPILIMHGDADEIVPWGGGVDPFGSEGRTFVSVDESVDLWRRNNGALGAPEVDSLQNERITRSRWKGEALESEVVLYRVAAWPHAWPGGKYTETLSSSDSMAGFEAIEEVWRFLKRHRNVSAGGDALATPEEFVPCAM